MTMTWNLITSHMPYSERLNDNNIAYFSIDAICDWLLIYDTLFQMLNKFVTIVLPFFCIGLKDKEFREYQHQETKITFRDRK